MTLGVQMQWLSCPAVLFAARGEPESPVSSFQVFLSICLICIRTERKPWTQRAELPMSEMPVKGGSAGFKQLGPGARMADAGTEAAGR